MPLRRCSGATATFRTCTSSWTSQKMRNATIRSLPFPCALVSGSIATRMVLQSCSSSRRKSSGDHGCLKAARSITITSSRSSGVIRLISSLARARTATSAALLRRHRPFGRLLADAGGRRRRLFQRIEDAHRGPLVQAREQFLEQALVLVAAHAIAQRLALARGELPPAQGLVELAVAQLRRELQ